MSSTGRPAEGDGSYAEKRDIELMSQDYDPKKRSYQPLFDKVEEIGRRLDALRASIAVDCRIAALERRIDELEDEVEERTGKPV